MKVHILTHKIAGNSKMEGDMDCFLSVRKFQKYFEYYLSFCAIRVLFGANPKELPWYVPFPQNSPTAYHFSEVIHLVGNLGLSLMVRPSAGNNLSCPAARIATPNDQIATHIWNFVQHFLCMQHSTFYSFCNKIPKRTDNSCANFENFINSCQCG